MSRVRLSLQTPLRLKAGGRLIETAPEFAVFWARLVTRIHLATGRAVLSAEALGVGGMTSFGLGAYRLDAA